LTFVPSFLLALRCLVFLFDFMRSSFLRTLFFFFLRTVFFDLLPTTLLFCFWEVFSFFGHFFFFASFILCFFLDSYFSPSIFFFSSELPGVPPPGSLPLLQISFGLLFSPLFFSFFPLFCSFVGSAFFFPTLFPVVSGLLDFPFVGAPPFIFFAHVGVSPLHPFWAFFLVPHSLPLSPTDQPFDYPSPDLNVLSVRNFSFFEHFFPPHVTRNFLSSCCSLSTSNRPPFAQVRFFFQVFFWQCFLTLFSLPPLFHLRRDSFFFSHSPVFFLRLFF